MWRGVRNLFMSHQSLFEACMVQDVDSALEILSNGGDPNKSNEHGLTPLHVAALTDRGRGVVEGLLRQCKEARAAWNEPVRRSGKGSRFSPAQVGRQKKQQGAACAK